MGSMWLCNAVAERRSHDSLGCAQVRDERYAGLHGVSCRHGVEQCAVFRFPRRASRVVRQVGDGESLDHVAQQSDELGRSCALSGFVERFVELTIALRPVHRVVGQLQLRLDGRDSAQGMWRVAGHCVDERVVLEQYTEIEDLGTLFLGQRGDVRAAVSPDLHQSFGVQLAERVADRNAADAEGLGELNLSQRSAGTERAGGDQVA